MKPEAFKTVRMAAAALCAAALALMSLGFATPAAWADDAEEPIGRLSIVSSFPEDGAFYDGHSYLAFVSYQNDLHLQFTNLYGYYEFTDTFKEAIKEDPTLLTLDKTGEDSPEISKYFTETLGDPINEDDPRYRKTSYECVLNRGDFITIGDYNMAEDGTQAIADLFVHSSSWKYLLGYASSEANEGYAEEDVLANLTDIIDQYSNGEMTAEEAEAETEECLAEAFTPDGVEIVKHLLMNSTVYDGNTTGGVFINRELWRQKSWQDLSENQVYSIDVTRTEMDDLLAFLNESSFVSGEAQGTNKYSWVCNNCSNVSSGSWNAAVGYVRDENGKKTETHSELYIEALDEEFPLIPCLAATPQKIYNVIKSWEGRDLGGTRETWAYIPQVSLPDEATDINSSGPADSSLGSGSAASSSGGSASSASSSSSRASWNGAHLFRTGGRLVNAFILGLIVLGIVGIALKTRKIIKKRSAAKTEKEDSEQ